MGTLDRGWKALAFSAALVATTVALSPALSSCSASCDRQPDEQPTRFTGGITNADGSVYQTARWEGPYIDFPPGRTLLLVHGLTGTPAVVDPWLAFEEHPISENRGPDDSNVARAAGNQAVIEEVTDEHIRVRNDTCSDVYLRVVATDPQ